MEQVDKVSKDVVDLNSTINHCDPIGTDRMLHPLHSLTAEYIVFSSA